MRGKPSDRYFICIFWGCWGWSAASSRAKCTVVVLRVYSRDGVTENLYSSGRGWQSFLQLFWWTARDTRRLKTLAKTVVTCSVLGRAGHCIVRVSVLLLLFSCYCFMHALCIPSIGQPLPLLSPTPPLISTKCFKLFLRVHSQP